MSAPLPGPFAAERIAIIGAGIAGLACARALKERGAQVVVFDKATVPGGRATTRVTPYGNFDHGAQYFNVHHHRFESELAAWRREGVVRPWSARVIAFSDRRVFDKAMSVDPLVTVPSMAELGRRLATGLDVHLSTQIARIDVSGGRRGVWHLHSTKGRGLGVGGFGVVVVAVPSPRAVALLNGLTDLVTPMSAVQWAPCWAAMVALAQPAGTNFDAAFVNDDPILGWVARDSVKPERAVVEGIAERWVLHAKPRWSQEYLEMEPTQAAQWLLRAFSARIGRGLQPRWLAAHRWRYATPVNPLPQACLWDARQRIGVCGDWCGGPRVEGAFLSGIAMAEAIAAG